MNVLVTGASGFLGSYLINALVQEGISTIIIGRSKPMDLSAGINFFQVDLLGCRDFDAIMAKFKPTHLIHLAWYAEHGKYWNSDVNLCWVEATVRLIEAFCLSGGRRVLGVGTCAEYDWEKGYCQEDVTPLKPVTLYGVAKDSARSLTNAICKEKHVEHVWGRIFFPYGPGESAMRLIPQLIEMYREVIPFKGVNAMAYRDFLFAGDVANALVLLIKSSITGDVNICSGQPVLIEDLVNKIAYLLNGDPSRVLSMRSEREGDPKFLVGDSSKLRALNWNQNRSLEAGLEYMVAERLRSLI